MVDIIQLRRNHYTGLDADKASVTGVIGDSYAATDKDKQYYWTAGGWKTGLGYEFVPRRTGVVDFAVGDFTTDGTVKVDGLDLSAIVPAGAVAVSIKFRISDDAANSAFFIRTNATDVMNIIETQTQVANIPAGAIETIPIDADCLMDYFGSNLAFIVINVTVMGWFI